MKKLGKELWFFFTYMDHKFSVDWMASVTGQTGSSDGIEKESETEDSVYSGTRVTWILGNSEPAILLWIYSWWNIK